MIKQSKQLIIVLAIGIILGASSVFIYDQHQNVTENEDEDTLNTPQEVKNFTFSNYNVYVDKNNTKVIGEIKNNSQNKRTVKFAVEFIDDNGESLGTSREISIDIDAETSKPFLAVINEPIDDYIDLTFNVIAE